MEYLCNLTNASNLNVSEMVYSWLIYNFPTGQYSGPYSIFSISETCGTLQYLWKVSLEFSEIIFGILSNIPSCIHFSLIICCFNFGQMPYYDLSSFSTNLKKP